jgi:transcriptional regulator of acetoin/glycerol metabolism
MTDKELRDKWLQLHRDPNARNCLRHEIKNSWDRCTARKVNPFLRENPYMCTASELTRHQAQAGFLIKASSSVMDNMFEFVAGTGFVVALADSALCVVKVIGDEESLAFAKKANLLEGTIWSEELVGTNAGALAYNLGRPISVFGYEHFCLFSHVAACSCAPIIDQGRIIGVLGMIAPFNRVSNHTLGIVVGAAKHIKYKLVMERPTTIMKYSWIPSRKACLPWTQTAI